MKYLILLLSIGLLTACGSSESESVAETPKESNTTAETPTAINQVLDVAAFLSKAETTENAVILDVRTPEEVAEGMIPKAQHFNFYDENFQTHLEDLDKEQPIFVYCKAGGRSAKTCGMMKELGFKEVYDLEGGYTAYAATNK